MNLFDLNKQTLQIRHQFIKKLNPILARSDFILGKETKKFEEEFEKFCKAKFAVGVNSGTDALFLCLKCLGIGIGDEVIVPAFSFIATSFAVTYSGAKPVFVDVNPLTYTIDVAKIEGAITKRTKAIIPVHLFGLCANMNEILRISKKHRTFVIEDAAQSHGAKINDKIAGSIGNFGCFSFYPTKNLGACGDAGMIITNSAVFHKKLLQLRDCGRGRQRYLHPIVGFNSRLDNIQAAFLSLKLKYLNMWTKKRISNANYYAKQLKNIKGVIAPKVPKGYKHVFHIYPIRTSKRKKLITKFKENKIPFSIFYQLPLHLQKANSYLKHKRGDFPISERVSKSILALPVHSSLKTKEINKIVKIIREVHNGKD